MYDVFWHIFCVMVEMVGSMMIIHSSKNIEAVHFKATDYGNMRGQSGQCGIIELL